jgi:hypothetical protein
MQRWTKATRGEIEELKQRLHAQKLQKLLRNNKSKTHRLTNQ